ncbi:MAG: UvrD-helicase domain-containing protein [Candidatus Margulisiibacteriota bacterium]
MNLSPHQEAALDTTHHLLVEAGAGSGKTTVLVERIIRILEASSEVHLSHLVALTFTAKAALELRERLQARYAPDSLDSAERYRRLKAIAAADIGTIHDWCGRFLRSTTLTTGLDPQFSIIEREEAALLWQEAVAQTWTTLSDGQDAGLKTLLKDFSAPKIREILKTLYQHKTKVVSWQNQGKFNSVSDPLLQTLLTLFSQCLTAFESAKSARSVLDFDGLLLQTRSLLEAHPSLAVAWRNRVRHVFVDEFQDTDPLQWEILQLLCCDTPYSDGHQSPINLFLVGDLKQSIYRFRGADPSLFASLLPVYAQSPGTQVVHLSDNFRSTASLVGFTNGLFEGLFKTTQTFSIPFTPSIAQRADTCPTPVHFVLVPPDGPNAETEAVIQHIRQLSQIHPFSDMALLARRRSDLDAWQALLSAAGIPAFVSTSPGFFQNQTIIELMDWVKALIEPDNTLAWVGVLKSTLFGLSDDGLYWLFEKKNHTLPDAIAQADLTQSPLGAADLTSLKHLQIHLSRWLERAKAEPLSTVLSGILTDTQGYERYAALPHPERQRRLIGLFLDRLMRLEEKPFLAPYDHLQLLDQMNTLSEAESDSLAPHMDNAITLLTVHAAKGLEFPIVILPHLHKPYNVGASDVLLISPTAGLGLSNPSPTGQTPQRQAVVAALTQETLEEEQRLFYVACTRAADQLLLSAVLKDPQKPLPDRPKSWLDFVLSQGELDAENRVIRFGWGQYGW